MVMQYLEETSGNGGEILPTETSVDAIVSLMYSDEGRTLIGDPEGCWSACIEVDEPWDTKFGKTAYSMGTYVEPESRGRGLASKIREKMISFLGDGGFDTLIGGVHVSNRAGMESLTERVGFTPHQVMGFRSLGGV